MMCCGGCTTHPHHPHTVIRNEHRNQITAVPETISFDYWNTAPPLWMDRLVKCIMNIKFSHVQCWVNAKKTQMLCSNYIHFQYFSIYLFCIFFTYVYMYLFRCAVWRTRKTVLAARHLSANANAGRWNYSERTSHTHTLDMCVRLTTHAPAQMGVRLRLRAGRICLQIPKIQSVYYRHYAHSVNRVRTCTQPHRNAPHRIASCVHAYMRAYKRPAMFVVRLSKQTPEKRSRARTISRDRHSHHGSITLNSNWAAFVALCGGRSLARK